MDQWALLLYVMDDVAVRGHGRGRGRGLFAMMGVRCGCCCRSLRTTDYPAVIDICIRCLTIAFGISQLHSEQDEFLGLMEVVVIDADGLASYHAR